jgi:hypothetical protein
VAGGAADGRSIMTMSSRLEREHPRVPRHHPAFRLGEWAIPVTTRLSSLQRERNRRLNRYKYCGERRGETYVRKLPRS